MSKKTIKSGTVQDFDSLLDTKYGKLGSKKRQQFEEGAQKFYISEMLKVARKEAKLTQTELADRIGSKKSYISRVENGKSNITIESLIKIFEVGLNRKVNIIIS